MSAVVLIPGRGGRYTSEAFTSAVTGADTIDCSRCTGFAIQQTLVGSPAGTFILEETIDGTNWASLGSNVTVGNGTITKYEASNRPFGIVRINAASVTGLSASVTLTVNMVGSAIGSGLF